MQDLASPNHQQHPVQDASSKQQTKQKCKPKLQQTGLQPHSALHIRGKTNKQRNKQELNTNLTLYKAYINHCANPRRSKVKSLSRVQLFATPWTVAYQVPLSMRFSRQEYWRGLHCLLHWVWLHGYKNYVCFICAHFSVYIKTQQKHIFKEKMYLPKQQVKTAVLQFKLSFL